jgi:hypothetical protein
MRPSLIRIENKINKWLRETTCPLCLGIDSMLYHYPSLGNFKGEMRLPVPLVCKTQHNVSVIGVNTPELFILSLMSEQQRPTKKVA